MLSLQSRLSKAYDCEVGFPILHDEEDVIMFKVDSLDKRMHGVLFYVCLS